MDAVVMAVRVITRPGCPQFPVLLCTVLLLVPYLTAYPVDIRTSSLDRDKRNPSKIAEDIFPNDQLTPYLSGRHGSKRTARDVATCKHVSWQNETFEVFPSKPSFPQSYQSLYELHRFADTSSDVYYGKKYMLGSIAYITSPYYTLSVLEPGKAGGCTMEYFTATRSTVQDTASNRKHGCKLAANAGYFDMITGECFGNVVSNVKIVQTANNDQNANFGIRQDGTIVVGYIPDEEITNRTNPFRQLVSGVIWLVRNGSNFVNESMKLECASHEETGSMETFVNVVSARSAIGHDRQGRVVLARVDGQTHHRGTNLFEFADLLIKHGVVNAINLDGGGSNTMVEEGVVINYLSDHCNFQPEYRCVRQVSTVLCVHDAECIEPDCSNHGSCNLGVCSCDPPWFGEGCGSLNCSLTNCSAHGVCDEGVCECDAGWNGDECEKRCVGEHYGAGCRQSCWCSYNQRCDPERGCVCKPGYSGAYWCTECNDGFYGADCAERCPDPDCSGNGQCSKMNGSCLCVEGWTGSSCNITAGTEGEGLGSSGAGSGDGTSLNSNSAGDEDLVSEIAASDWSDGLNQSSQTTPPPLSMQNQPTSAPHSAGMETTTTAPAAPDSSHPNKSVSSSTLTATVFTSLLIGLATLIVHALFCFLTRKWAYRAAIRDTLGLPRRPSSSSSSARPPRKRRRKRRRKKGQMEPLPPIQSSSDCSI